MNPIFISLSPNVESDDMWLALQLLLQPWKWFSGDARGEVEQYFRDMLGAKHAFAFDSGRSALYAVLESLHLEKDEEVLLQAYTCVAVPNAVLWAGAKPVYIDADPATFSLSLDDLEKKITQKSRVLIVQHTFGIPAPMNTILDIAEKHDLFVIEDCAHALGAKYRGKPAGSFGHAAFFSFGRDKVVSSVFGGILVTRSEIVAERIREHLAERANPARMWIFRVLLHPVLTALFKKTYHWWGMGKFGLAFATHTRILPRAVTQEEKYGGKPSFTSKKMAPVIARLTIHQLEKLERLNAHRRMIAGLYRETIRSRKIRHPRLSPVSLPVFLRYTILTSRAEELRKKAKKGNIFLGDWYAIAIAPADVDYEKIQYRPVLCPNAEAMAKKSLNLPTDVSISPEDAKRIAEFINNHA